MLLIEVGHIVYYYFSHSHILYIQTFSLFVYLTQKCNNHVFFCQQFSISSFQLHLAQLERLETLRILIIKINEYSIILEKNAANNVVNFCRFLESRRLHFRQFIIKKNHFESGWQYREHVYFAFLGQPRFNCEMKNAII